MNAPEQPKLFNCQPPMCAGELPEEAFHDPVSEAKWAVAKQIFADILKLKTVPSGGGWWTCPQCATSVEHGQQHTCDRMLRLATGIAGPLRESPGERSGKTPRTA